MVITKRRAFGNALLNGGLLFILHEYMTIANANWMLVLLLTLQTEICVFVHLKILVLKLKKWSESEGGMFYDQNPYTVLSDATRPIQIHTHLLQMWVWILHLFIFLSLGLLWNLKNNNLFKGAQFWCINTHMQSLFYLTECVSFLPKGKQTFPHKSPLVFPELLGLTVNLATAICREAAVTQSGFPLPF